MAVLSRINRYLSLTVLTVAVTLATPAPAAAGMPAITLHDVVKLRLEVVSFFLGVLLLSAAVVYALWHWLRRDFQWLPRLSYAKACAIVALWGVLFVVVLTMISGARELMTPGAWERSGWTYDLTSRAEDRALRESEDDLARRRERLGEFWSTLLTFTAAHGGQFPSREQLEELPESVRSLPDGSGLSYVYVPDQAPGGEEQLLAHEPVVAGETSLALFTTGEMHALQFAELDRLRQLEEQ